MTRKLGGWLDAIVQRIWKLFRKTPPTGIVQGMLDMRERSTALLTRYGLRGFAAAVIAKLAWFVVLEIALWCVGIGPDVLSPSAVMAAMAVVGILSLVAITPGAVGVAEVTYIGILSSVAGSGLTEQLTAAVMLFRIAQWLVPIPIGWVLLIVLRRGHEGDLLGHATAPTPSYELSGALQPARVASWVFGFRPAAIVGCATACNDGGMGDPEEAVAVRAPGVVARGALYGRLSAGVAAGVTLVSAPPGSGKTVLLRSWVDSAGLRARTAWVLVERHERDAQHFWLSVVEQLRSAIGRDGLMQKLAPTPEFDGEGLVRRLISELEALDEPVVLVIDDLHELASPEAQGQLELLLAGRPRLLYVVLATRHDPSLGLHRLRLAGELTELRAADLRLSAEEAAQLLDASGVELSAEVAAVLLARTEGWAAGLRLATMSLAGHPDPERFVAEFAGSERTVADYLLAEVLERQPEEVKRLLLRTSILERVCGPLADRLVALAAQSGRSSSWRTRTPSSFRSTQIGRGSATTRCSRISCSSSFGAANPMPSRISTGSPPTGSPSMGTPSTRFATPRPAATGMRAGRLLADHGLSLSLDGQVATIGALLAAFPADARLDPELAAVRAYVELRQHSLEAAAAYITLAERHASEVLAERQHQLLHHARVRPAGARPAAR